jgi:membrane fusion protein (multidrug efflux system)
VPSANAALARANADYERYSSLTKTGDASQQQLDATRATQAQALSQYRGALDQVTSAQTNVAQMQARETAAIAAATAAQSGIGAGEGQLQTAQGRLVESSAPSRVPLIAAQAGAAEAQVNSASSQAQTAKDQLNYTTIRSPIDGIVGAKNIEVGATVSPGQALLELVPQASKLYITANFKETQLTNMKVGQDVDVDVDAYKGTVFHGRVESLGPASQNTFSLIPAQNATGNFVKVTQRLPVRIAIVDPPADKPLAVGMSVEASVKVK